MMWKPTCRQVARQVGTPQYVVTMLRGLVQWVLHPAHEVTQLVANLLDRVIGVLGAQLLQLLVAALNVGEQPLGEGAVLNVGQNVPHAA